MTTPTPGVYPDTEMSTYLGWRAASNSGLKILRKSAEHLLTYMEHSAPDTDAFFLGKAVHCALLEPDLLPVRYTKADPCMAILASGDRKGQPCGSSASYLHPEHGWLCGTHAKRLNGFDTSKIVLSHTDHAICMGIRDSAQKRATVRALVNDASALEVSALWHESETGVLTKGRLDALSVVQKHGVIGDVKTTEDASEKAFTREIWKYGYHIQGGLYTDGAAVLGLGAQHYVFIAAEKKPPYAVATYRLDEGALDAGIQRARPLLRQFQQCMDTGLWPGYPDEFVDISIPSWAFAQTDDEIRESVTHE